MCSAIKYQAVCQKDFTVHSPLFGRGTAALGDFLSSNRLKYGQLRVRITTTGEFLAAHGVFLKSESTFIYQDWWNAVFFTISK